MTSPLAILNCYGPYWNRKFFWDRLLIGGLLTTPNLILGGDLNLTLNTLETWGTKVVLDPFASHFKLLFDSVNLVDVDPLDVGPTWRNGRVGDDGISKRLDRFLLFSSLIPVLKFHHVWAHPTDMP